MPSLDQFSSGADEIEKRKLEAPTPAPTQRIEYNAEEKSISPIQEEDSHKGAGFFGGDARDIGTGGQQIAADVALAPARAIEEGFHDLVGLTGIKTDKRLLGKPVTGVGKGVQGIANFGTMMIGAGKLLKLTGLGAKATAFINSSPKLAGLAKFISKPVVKLFTAGMAPGAVADFVSVDPNEDRLSDMTNTIPGLDLITPDFLVTDEDDSTFERRVDNVIEGALLGGVIGVGAGALGKTFRAGRALFKAKAAGAAPEVIEAASKKLGKAIDGVESAASKEAKSQVVNIPSSINTSKLDVELIGKEILEHKKGVDGFKESIGHAVNFDKIDSPEAAVDLVESLAKKVKGTDVLKNKDLVDRALKDMGDGITADELSELITMNVADAKNINESIIRSTISKELHLASTDALWKTADAALEDSAAMTKWLKNLKVNVAILKSGDELSSAYARGLQAQKAAIKLNPNFSFDHIDDLIKNPEKGIEFVKTFKTGGTLSDKSRLLASAKGGLITDLINLQTQAMLANVVGRVVDFSGTAIRVLTLPIKELFVDLFAGKGLKRSLLQLTQYNTYRKSMGIAQRHAMKAYKSGTGVLAPNASDADALLKDTLTPNTQKGLSGGLSKMIRWAGNMYSYAGSRLSIGTDEFAKQITARAHASVSLTNDALDLGLKGSQVDSYVNKNLAELFKGGGDLLTKDKMALDLYKRGIEEGLTTKQAFTKASAVASDNNMKKLIKTAEGALKYAKEATFQEDLIGFTKKYDGLANEYAVLAYTTRFRKTLVNLTKLSMSPILGARNLARSLSEEIVSKEPEIRRRAISQLVDGVMFWGAAWGIMEAGSVSGSGPSNLAERKALEATGWRPYSIRIGNSYYSYARLEPFSTILGLMSDTVDSFDEFNYHDFENDPTEVLGAQFLILKENVSNKTYAKGLAELLDLLTDPDENGLQLKRFLKSGVSSFVPGNLNALTNATTDEYAREVRGILDGPRNKLPGGRAGLPYKRNLLGEKAKHYTADMNTAEKFISPFMRSNVVDDVVFEELVNIKARLTLPSKSRAGVRDLTKILNEDGMTAYDVFQQKIGEVKLSGKTLRQALEAKIRNRSYQRLDPAATNEFESARTPVLRSIINKYRKAAFRDTVREIPELQTQVKGIKSVKQRQRRGEKLDKLLQIVEGVSNE